MTKRHTKQTSKQALGQYFTTNADRILSGFEDLIKNKNVIDPFAGGWDLLYWAQKNGASSVSAYDIEPKVDGTELKDSLLNPPSYSGSFVLTNPPYLASNKSKSKYKDIFAKWNQSDLYKCFLASITNAEEAIVIIPSNFLCESNSKARSMLFASYNVVSAKYWKEQVFDDATTGVCALYIKQKQGLNNGIQEFPCLLLPENKQITMRLEKNHGYLHGGHELTSLNRSFEFEKVYEQNINTNIVVGCLDGGKYELGFYYNDKEPIRAPKTVITTFQVNTVGFTLTESQQIEVIDCANAMLTRLRNQYDSMFLSNYMGATQKIMSVSIAKSLLSHATKKVVDKHTETV